LKDWLKTGGANMHFFKSEGALAPCPPLPTPMSHPATEEEDNGTL